MPTGFLLKSTITIIFKKSFKSIFKNIVVFSIALLFLQSCASSVRFSSSGSKTDSKGNPQTGGGTPITPGATFRGMASYYADKFDGRTTANGEIFDQNELTAAHRTFPFGTVLKVTNIKNNRSVVVRVNDRGPFAEGRILDLSRRAAEELDIIRAGVAEVEIEVLR
ncbi:MAG: septal ring lytic transglycosylase RlpA family protein [Bacteroidota bacterium]